MKKIVFAILLAGLSMTLLYADGKPGLSRMGKTTVAWAKRAQQKAGGFSMWLSNQMVMGIQAWDGSPPQDDADCKDKNPGLGASYPPGACNEHLYGAGPWIGGLVRGVRVVAQGYNGNTGYGYFVPSQKDTARDKMWISDARDTLYDANLHDQVNSSDRRRLYHLYRKNPSDSGVAYTVNRRTVDDDGDGLIDEDELDGFDNDGDWSRDPNTHSLVYDNAGHLIDDLGSDDLPDSLELGCKGGYDPVTNLDPAFDNYDPGSRDLCHPDNTGNFPKKNDKNIFTQNNGLPDHGEPRVDEDFGAYSEHDIYFGSTDTISQPQNPTHNPLKVKVWARSYAWEQSYFKCLMPIEYYYVNIGRDTIKDVYVGFFADMDVGPVVNGSYATTNYAAYFSDIRTAYIHDPADVGATPLGLTVLNTPAPLENLQYVFQWHDFNPPCGGTADSALYSCMSCEAFDYDRCIKDDQSPTVLSDTRFIFSFGNKHYDPTDSSTWVQDPKFSKLAPGDTLKIEVAFITGDAVQNGQNNLYDNATKALKLWGRSYHTPVVPPAPCVDTTVGYKKVVLRWGALGGIDCPNPVETWDDSNKIAQAEPDTSWRRRNPPAGHTLGGRIFEGYRLYRSESETFDQNSFTLLKQFDVPGDSFGYNVGLDTLFVDTNLFRGKTYWYAVTSFGIPDLTIITHPNSENPSILDTLKLLGEPPESGISEHNAIKVALPFSSSDRLGEVLVVPNPYLGSETYTRQNGGWEGDTQTWQETNRLVKFIHLPRKCTIRIFSLAGDLVKTIEHEVTGEDRGEENYNLLSESNRALASGIYVFSVESNLGRQVGKFVIIR